MSEDHLEQYDNVDLYEILSINRNANEAEIKKAYYMNSLKCHPDRVSAEEDKYWATKKFQALGKAYSILSDQERRKVYDETGEADNDRFRKIGNWDSYWREMFKKISVTDIMDFETKYKDSEEELTDLKEAYFASEGDMDIILSTVLCSYPGDENRFSEIINEWIKKEEVPPFEKFTKITQKQIDNRKRRAMLEEREAKIIKQSMAAHDSESLLTYQIKRKCKERESQMDKFYNSLLEKYGNEKNDKK